MNLLYFILLILIFLLQIPILGLNVACGNLLSLLLIHTVGIDLWMSLLIFWYPILINDVSIFPLTLLIFFLCLFYNNISLITMIAFSLILWHFDLLRKGVVIWKPSTVLWSLLAPNHENFIHLFNFIIGILLFSELNEWFRCLILRWRGENSLLSLWWKWLVLNCLCLLCLSIVVITYLGFGYLVIRPLICFKDVLVFSNNHILHIAKRLI